MTLNSDSAHWLNDKLSASYGTKYKPNLGRELYDEFRDQITDSQLKEAIKRHRKNQTEQRDGTPIGSWPPTIAHVEQQLTRMFEEKVRERQAAEKKKRSQESDQTYSQAMKSEIWRDEIRKGGKIREALRIKYSLQTGRSQDEKLVMDTLDLMRDDRGLIDDIPRAIETAAKLIIARDQQTAAKEAA